MRWYKEPLLHFLLIGGLFFLLFALKEDGQWAEEDELTIVVDKPALLAFMQFRAKAFNQEVFEQQLAQMSDEERRALVDQYIEEEVLYREAKRMAMDEDDYIIRRRLVQKMEFITRGLTEQMVTATEDELHKWYQDNRQQFFQPSTITFTHVYFSGDKRGWEQAKADAEAMLRDFKQQQSAPEFSESVGFGDRFPFHLNYVERSKEFVASHFGGEFSEQVFAEEGDQWRGVYTSAYGYHLVLEATREPESYTPFEQARTKVEDNVKQEKIRQLQQKAVKAIIEQYDVSVDLGDQKP